MFSLKAFFKRLLSESHLKATFSCLNLAVVLQCSSLQVRRTLRDIPGGAVV